MARPLSDGWLRLGAGSPVAQALFLLALVIAVWLVYRPGLVGPYVFDDFQNITRNPPIAMKALTWSNLLSAAFSKAEEGLGRPIAMASFAINYLYAGSSFNPIAFKLTNLVIHCINAFLVFALAREFFRLRPVGVSSVSPIADNRRALMTAMFAAALWALHPLQLTSVLYTVQRMTSMSAFFVFAGLLIFVLGRRRLAENDAVAIAWMAAGLAGGTLLGLLCKENAVLLPMLAGTVELFFFSREALSPRARRRLRLFYLCFVVMPVLAGIVFVLMNPEFVLRGYARRDFTLTERVLTEFRALFFYVSLIFVPLISKFGLYHDDFGLSTGLLHPPSTLAAVLCWLAIGAAVLAGIRRRSLWAFGIAWFLVGHALESTVIGLEIIHEHRNYVPSVGPLAVIAYYLAALVKGSRFDPRTVAVGAMCILLVFGFVTHTRAQSWSSRPLLFEFLVRYHPGSYRALSGLAAGMRDQQRDARAVYKTLKDAALAKPDTVYPLIEMQKMLHALIPASDRVVDDVSPAVESQREKLGWTKDAVLDREYLLELDREVAKEISRRLTIGTTHVETVQALWSAQSCAINGRDHCLPLVDRLIDWHMIALERLPPANKRRGLVELSAAKLFALRGEVDKALEYVDRSIKTMSFHPRYRAQKALLLIKLGAVDQAERITDAIEGEMDWRKIYIPDVSVLRQEIRNARMRALDRAEAVDAGSDD
ncbi:MAG: hypothetical protein OER43_03430 [Gammaproteobacteria bacterium]|nr:hypothetical protein [Gammaproteobacteria bacterium]